MLDNTVVYGRVGYYILNFMVIIIEIANIMVVYKVCHLFAKL